MDLLKRKIEQDLIKWKNTENHKPLIVKGCRQCGKTYSVKKFAEENYKYVVYINFFSNPDYVSIFSGSLEVDNLTMMMSALLGPNVMFVPNETVIILDEIQECPEARTALKFFKTDGRYDVIGTGSLLGSLVAAGVIGLRLARHRADEVRVDSHGEAHHIDGFDNVRSPVATLLVRLDLVDYHVVLLLTVG